MAGDYCKFMEVSDSPFGLPDVECLDHPGRKTWRPSTEDCNECTERDTQIITSALIECIANNDKYETLHVLGEIRRYLEYTNQRLSLTYLGNESLDIKKAEFAGECEWSTRYDSIGELRKGDSFIGNDFAYPKGERFLFWKDRQGPECNVLIELDVTDWDQYKFDLVPSPNSKNY